MIQINCFKVFNIRLVKQLKFVRFCLLSRGKNFLLRKCCRNMKWISCTGIAKGVWSVTVDKKVSTLFVWFLKPSLFAGNGEKWRWDAFAADFCCCVSIVEWHPRPSKLQVHLNEKSLFCTSFSCSTENWTFTFWQVWTTVGEISHR